MTLQDVLRLLDQLTEGELERLREQIELRQKRRDWPGAAALDSAVKELREGLDERQLDQLEWAMNVETVPPLDRSAWQE
jgi:hypothetical protein